MIMGFIEILFILTLFVHLFGVWIKIRCVLRQRVEGLYDDPYQVYHTMTKFTTASMEEPYFHVQPHPEIWIWTGIYSPNGWSDIHCRVTHISTDWTVNQHPDSDSSVTGLTLNPNRTEVNSVTVRLSFVICRMIFFVTYRWK